MGVIVRDSSIRRKRVHKTWSSILDYLDGLRRPQINVDLYEASEDVSFYVGEYQNKLEPLTKIPEMDDAAIHQDDYAPISFLSRR